MPTLVLLPGMDGTGDLFDPFIAALEALGDQGKVCVIRYPRDVVLGYEALQDFVRAALPVNEPYVILGESFSGPIAIALAAEADFSLKGLVLCSTFARNPRPGLTGAGLLLPLVPFRWLPSFALSEFLLGRFSTATLRIAIAKAVGQVAPAVLRERLRAVLAVDSSALLRQVQVPCICLRATQDRLVPETASLHIKATLPASSVVQVEAPHCLLQAAPREAAGVVSSFIRALQIAA